VLKKPYPTKRFLVFTLAALSMPLVSFATQTITTSPGLETISNNTPTTLVSANTIFSIPQYTGPGTLMNVELVLDLSSNPYLQAYNSNMMDSETFTKASASIGAATANVSFPGVTDATSVSTVPTTITVKKTTGPENTVDPGATNEYSGTDQTADSATFFVPVADLSEFEGSGSIPLTVALAESLDKVNGVGGSPFIDFGTGNDLEGFLTVDYFYCSCVPEPSSLSLIALSLGALVLGRRFWIKRANNLS
jgi:hypothetical protein